MSLSTYIHPKGLSAEDTASSSHFILDSPSTFPSPSSSFESTAAPVMASPATVYSDGMYQPPIRHQVGEHSHAIPVDFTRAPPKGVVRFRPFENSLDAAARSSIAEFQVFPFGEIEKYCRHIPYASGKKDFFEKTGRESFEVFQYTFKMPGDEKEYHIMWDYNVGLVRMTPFFKCCKYSKTTPAKMLNLNPGLRDITHSITGGSIMAQGYWMPFACAKAVCATFCYNVAGALIPIFGQDFPSECLPPHSPDYGRMVIDRVLIEEAIIETECMRQLSGRRLDNTHSGSYHRDHISQQNQGPKALQGLVIRPSYVYSDSISSAEGDLKLAPMRYMAPFQQSMHPSSIGIERLPPFSHIASLPPLSSPASALPSLPPRKSHLSHGLHNYHMRRSPAVEMRQQEQMMSVIASDHEQRPTRPMHGYEIWNAHSRNNRNPHTFVSTTESFAGQPQISSLVASNTCMPCYQEQSQHQNQQRREYGQRSAHPATQPSSNQGRVAVLQDPKQFDAHEDADIGRDYSDSDEEHLTQASCCPYPPQPSSHFTRGMRPTKRQALFLEQSASGTETISCLKPSGSHGDPILHFRQMMHSHRGLQAASGCVDPSFRPPTWNTKDVDTAELLVNL